MRELVFGVSGFLRFQRRQVMIDFGVADGQRALDLALAQALDDDFVADVFTILGVVYFFLCELLAEFFGRHLVVLGDALYRALDLRVVDAQAGFLRILHQRPLGDDALEHLFIENIGGRRLDVLLFHLRQHDALWRHRPRAA